MKKPPDPLERLLNRWSDLPPTSSQLAGNVRRRIAAAREPEGTWRGWMDRLDLWFARPAFAALFIVCCTLLALLVAEIRVNQRQRERNDQLARSYLQLIDPLLVADNNHPPRS